MSVLLRLLRISLPLYLLAGLLGLLALGSSFTSHDLDFSELLQRTRSSGLTRIMTFISACANPPVALATICAVTIIFLILRHPETAWRSLAMIFTGWQSTLLLKILIDRPRPPHEHMLVEAHSASFPSGHVAYTFACIAAIFISCHSLQRRIAIITIGGIVLALMMFSRIYLGDHYLSDVTGALLSSAAACYGVHVLWEAYVHRYFASI